MEPSTETTPAGTLNETIDAERAFGEDLMRPPRAIAERDRGALETTLADAIVLVTADGEVIADRDVFLERHRDWFTTPGWKMDVTELHRHVGVDVATVILQLEYRPDGDAGPRVPSVLHLTFVRRGDRWLMSEDQNTAVRAG